MYSPLQSAVKYMRYYYQAADGKGHGMHSPFIFEFITRVLNDKNEYPAYEKVEALRQHLRKDTTVLTIEDFGAGSSVSKSDRRTVSSIAKNAAKPKKFGQLLYRMVQYYRPATVLELGTSLGITTAYLASAHPSARIITLEGAKAIGEMAQQHFRQLSLHHIEQVSGNFDDTLPSLLTQLSAIDFCFIDGNHRLEPTQRYFEQLLPHLHNDSILIFDDIHWSAGMETAWNTIRSHPSVRCSVDLFFIGIVFFRREFMEKQHFAIRF